MAFEAARRRLRRRIAILVDPKRRFNCADQRQATWEQRAERAVELLTASPIAARSERSQTLHIGDFGCGNERLRAILHKELQGPFAYRGYDLHPQSPDVTRIDLQHELPRERFDIVFCLGVLEYLSDAEAFVRRLGSACQAAIVSYVTTDASDSLSSPERRQRGWLNDFTRAELEDIFSRNGWVRGDVMTTPDARTVVWLWRLPAAVGSGEPALETSG